MPGFRKSGHICEIHGDDFNAEWLDGVTDRSHSTSASVDNSGQDIRLALMRYFSQRTSGLDTY